MKLSSLATKIVGWQLAVALCAPAGAQVALAPSTSPAPVTLRQARLYAIASARSLDHVNRNDVRAAMKTLLDILARQRGFLLDSRIDITDTVAEVRQRLENQSVDFLTLSVQDYLELESTHLLTPVLAHGRGPEGVSRYCFLLLVNGSPAEPTLAGLRGKTVLAFSRAGADTGAAWIDVMLSKEKLGRAAAFLSSLTLTASAQACILPVFFGRADACVVDEINFNLVREMNPQLGRLRTIAKSSPMMESLIAIPTKPHPYRKELLDSLLTLHEDPRGRQLLMAFKTDRLVPVAPGDLDTARELWRQYEALPGAESHLPASGLPLAGREKD